ncbi:MAG TPA: hypothetical protein DCG75_04510 [Bacteroidales bacterium]|nr:hypothetical protein [Bacteroidales bacterium]
MTKLKSELIQELRDLNKNPDTEIVPFIGAGSSKLLGLPDWKELIEQYHKYVGCTISLESIKKDLKEDLSKVADLIFENSGKDFDLYYEFMGGITPKNTGYTALHAVLVKNFQKIITTNYDQAFENALSDDNINDYKLLVYPNNLMSIDFQGRVIAYIHGHIKSGIYVFRNEEYEQAYLHDTKIKSFLTEIISKKVLVFIGFSFSDKMFRNTVKQIIAETNAVREKEEQVFGKKSKTNFEQKLYVLFPSENLKTKVFKHDLSKLGINYDEIEDHISLNGEDDSLEMKVLELEESANLLKIELGENYNKLNELYLRTEKNRDMLKYFSNLKIEVVEYDENNTIEIEEIIRLITKEEIKHSDDLSEARNIKN